MANLTPKSFFVGSDVGGGSNVYTVGDTVGNYSIMISFKPRNFKFNKPPPGGGGGL